jgi:hypothetical protein
VELTREQIESYRDRTYCRTRALQVRSIPAALKFVNRVGFCFAFTAQRSELPCLWHAACGERQPVYPEHTHSDPYIGLVWEAKDVLPAQRKIYYGKALKNRPSMISLTYLPFFYRLVAGQAGPDRYLRDYMRGVLSPAAKRIMEALLDRSPQVTSELKLSSGYAHPRKRTEFDRAMAELQMSLQVCKIAEFYDPFSFLWDLVSLRYLEQIDAARGVTDGEARRRILEKYFEIVGVSEQAAIVRLFQWEPGATTGTLQEMRREGVLVPVLFRGEKKEQLGWQGLKP